MFSETMELDNFTDLSSLFNDSVNRSVNITISNSYMALKYEALITLFICSIGVIGNISNIIVLRMRKTQTGLDYIGRAAILGLLALALSDLMFCIIGFFSGLVVTIASGDLTSGSSAFHHVAIIGFALNMYRSACINIFLFTSTWYITLLSIERYIVVCHPFKSLTFVNGRSVLISRMIVILLSLVVNVPLFARFQLRWYVCEDNLKCLYSSPSPAWYREPLMTFHWVSWAAIGTVLPLLLLIFTTVKLIKELLKVNIGVRRNGKVIFHVTKTLVAIAITYMVLVCPSMFLDFLQIHNLVKTNKLYELLVRLGNIAQAFKFSCNFLLYCTINKCFRQSLC